eukprot:14885931-Ditylum_brightwellii.AAC.1
MVALSPSLFFLWQELKLHGAVASTHVCFNSKVTLGKLKQRNCKFPKEYSLEFRRFHQRANYVAACSGSMRYKLARGLKREKRSIKLINGKPQQNTPGITLAPGWSPEE